MKKVILLLLFFPLSFLAIAGKKPLNLMIAPGSLGETGVALLWDKQYIHNKAASYTILLNGKKSGTTALTNFLFNGLVPGKTYTVTVTVNGLKKITGNTIRFTTSAAGKRLLITDFGAKTDSGFLNTTAIQSAINACTEGGTVIIPRGTFLSGALWLKSNMTLQIDSGAVLKGSADPADYLPMYQNRFEGWEMKTYASLLNAGVMSREEKYSVTNLRITGGGTVQGAGKTLGNAMIQQAGVRGRGRLVCFMNVQDVSIDNLTIRDSPCWTLHYIYSNRVSLWNLNIISSARNSDGIDPDSSTDSFIFNCSFDNGDDCIAIKSGKNPEGFFVGKPTRNVRITNCDFKRGHGISIGSEMSGGVSDVLVQDCKAGNLLNGLQIKGTKERGGYVRNVVVSDCDLQQITVYTELGYNNDGEAAPEVPVFENFVFKNINLSGAGIKEPVMNINGFKTAAHRLMNLVFENIQLPEGGRIKIKDADNAVFRNVLPASGKKPEYEISNCNNLIN